MNYIFKHIPLFCGFILFAFYTTSLYSFKTFIVYIILFIKFFCYFFKLLFSFDRPSFKLSFLPFFNNVDFILYNHKIKFFSWFIKLVIYFICIYSFISVDSSNFKVRFIILFYSLEYEKLFQILLLYNYSL